MAWGTNFKTDININREIFDNVKQIEERIIEIEKELEYWEKSLIVFPLLEKPKLEGEELDDLSHWYLNGMGGKLDIIKENTILLYKLQALLDEVKFNNLDLKKA